MHVCACMGGWMHVHVCVPVWVHVKAWVGEFDCICLHMCLYVLRVPVYECMRVHVPAWVPACVCIR